MNPILSEAELKHDLDVMLSEHNASGDAWGQHPAMSYGNNLHGFVNLRNLIRLAVKELSAEGKVGSLSIFTGE